MGSYATGGLDKLKESMCGLFCGPCMVILGMILIGWNEMSSISTWRDIQDAKDSRIEVPCGTSYAMMVAGTVSPAIKAGDLVYGGLGCKVTDMASITDQAVPSVTSMGEGSYMDRSVKMWLNVQRCTTTKNKVGGGETTSCTWSIELQTSWPSNSNDKDPDQNSENAKNSQYKATWDALNLNSMSPTYCNSAAFTTASYQAQGPKNSTGTTCVVDGTKSGGTMGLPKEVLTKLTQSTNCPECKKSISGVNIGTPSAAAVFGPSGNATTAPTTVSKSSSSFFADGKKYTKSGSKFCSDPTCQKGIGNSELSWITTAFTKVSVMGTLVVMEDTQGGGLLGLTEVVSTRTAGKDLTYASLGDRTADELLADAEAENATITWILRFVAFIIIWMGMVTFFAPATQFFSMIHDSIGEALESLICCITCPPACCCSLFLIALCWVAFRPIVAIPVLLVGCCIGGGGGFLAYTQSQKKKQARDYGDAAQPSAPV